MNQRPTPEDLHALGLGPYGFRLCIRIVLQTRISPDRIASIPDLRVVEDEPDGNMAIEWRTRRMKRGDDETIVYEVMHMMHNLFDISEDEWRVDWDRSTY